MEEKNKKEAQALAKKLRTESLPSPGRQRLKINLWTIDAQEIEKLLKSEDYDIDKKISSWSEPIKSLGAYSVDFKAASRVSPLKLKFSGSQEIKPYQ